MAKKEQSLFNILTSKLHKLKASPRNESRREDYLKRLENTGIKLSNSKPMKIHRPKYKDD